MPSTVGRRTVVPLTNKSGGSVAAGDVVVIDTGNNDAFTTNTTSSSTKVIGVVQETIANNATGRVCTAGYVALVNVNASVTRGNYGVTHTVAKQATDGGASRGAGTFCQFLTGGTTPDAFLFGLSDTGAGSLTDHTHAATGSGSTGGGATLSPTTFNAPQTSPGTTEGRLGWNTTDHRLEGYDTQRARAINPVGWQPVGVAWNYSSTAALTTAQNLAANGGSAAIAIPLSGHMLLDSVSVRNSDTATARTWGWDLYVQRLNNGNAGENTLDRVAASSADDSFTPGGAASTRTVTAASGPIYLPAGLYWLVIQNRHATNTFGLACTLTSNNFGPNHNQTKTTTNPNGATLDFVAATWTKDRNIYAVWLRGRVFGETAIF